ncbi:MAG: amidohydrolase family protein [Alphaproteobacteria bacterium]|nr:amidohydrolase family protein [Alphaproteobacteria bacterium]
MLRLIFSAILLASGAAAAATPDETATKWDVAAPPLGDMRDVKIEVSEGTWMNIDVSPDGRSIVFDLLGDIYVLPMAGGEATSIADGLAWDMQPRYSPDGKSIAFTSDRGGGDNIWVMNVDGSDKRQVTKETFRLLNNPTWSADGRFIAARKHFTTQRSLGVGEIWLYHLSGGDGVQLVERPSERHQKELGEPIFSRDGRYIYYSQDITPGATFIYAQDSNAEIFDIKRYDMTTGEVSTAVSGAGGAVRPTPSPDGKRIAFVRRERMQSKLYVKDLSTGAESAIFDDLDRDLQEIWAVHGVYPNMDWTPDSREVVFWAGGKIRRVNASTGASTIVPFRVSSTRAVASAPRPAKAVAPDTFRTRMVKFASLSPGGETVVFESLGKLWVRQLPNGEPRRLTRQADDFEFFPSWSRDGSRIVYTSWNDEDLATVRIVAAAGGDGRAVTTVPGHYRAPRFSPDGAMIVFEKGEGGGIVNDDYSEDPGVYRMASAGGEMTLVAKSGGRPHFAADPDRIYMTETDGDKGMLVSVNLNGNERRVHAAGDLVTDFQAAPSGDYLAFRENYNVYAMPMTAGPQKVSVGRKASAAPVVRASKHAGDYMNWAGDRLAWSMGPTLFSASVADMIPVKPKAASKDGENGEDGVGAGWTPPTTGTDLSMQATAAKPTGVVAITGARIVTMADVDGGIIDNGTLVIRGDRIAAVGAELAPPAGAVIIDAKGKTIIPGLIDAHAHGPQGTGDIIPQQNWEAMSTLALGVTTVHDPSNPASHVFAASEYQRVGEIPSPRIFSTGEIVYGAKAPGFYAIVDSYDDALDHVRRLKAEGAHSIKNYNQPRRDQRQQVIAAAKAENLEVVAEGGSLFHMDMGLIQDGITSIEHNLPQEHLYEDVLQLWSGSDAAYTPTLVVAFGGVNGDSYWRDRTNVWEHPILSAHAPPRVLQASSVRRQKAPDEDYYDQVAAREAKKLANRGVTVSIGAHGQEEGLAAHWELWSFVRGGMSPVEALMTGTIRPARHLGFDKDLGSIEEGKLADLVILSADPTEDIRNSDKIEQVMLGGRLYDAATLDEMKTGAAKRKDYWWESPPRRP